MRTLLIIIALLVSASAVAQNVPGPIVANGMRIYAGGERLKKSETKELFRGTAAWDTYRKANSQHIAGNILLWSGLGFAGIGTFGSYLSYIIWVMGELGPKPSFWSSGVPIFLGMALAGTGMVVGGAMLLGNARRNVAGAAELYNSFSVEPRLGPELSLGVTPGGLGLSLAF